jgi:Fe-S-cluster containining protein
MDIPLQLVDALFMVHCGDKVGIKDTIIRPHPKYDNMELVFICKEDTRGNISNQPCVFLVDGKCAIYESRPTICRMYGTEFMRCRYEARGCSSYKHNLSIDDIREMDEYASSKSKIKDMIERVII